MENTCGKTHTYSIGTWHGIMVTVGCVTNSATSG